MLALADCALPTHSPSPASRRASLTITDAPPRIDPHHPSQGNAFDACAHGGPHAFRRAFFNAYKGPHSALQNVDAFVCNHPPALCELYMPFNKSIVVIASVAPSQLFPLVTTAS